ncbi:MAG: MarR family transcriptional regulator, partial [SAR324 cluster bacterium]|nr:MarR family transcriptional regulator [SAR324 cluster bacterium]
VDRVTLAEIADATGLRKQNLSRWALKRMGQSIELKSNEDDRRIKEIVLIDPGQGQEYVEAVARTLGIDTRDR